MLHHAGPRTLRGRPPSIQTPSPPHRTPTQPTGIPPMLQHAHPHALRGGRPLTFIMLLPVVLMFASDLVAASHPPSSLNPISVDPSISPTGAAGNQADRQLLSGSSNSNDTTATNPATPDKVDAETSEPAPYPDFAIAKGVRAAAKAQRQAAREERKRLVQQQREARKQTRKEKRGSAAVTQAVAPKLAGPLSE